MAEDVVLCLGLLKHINSSDLTIGVKAVQAAKNLTVRKPDGRAHTMKCHRAVGGGVIVEGVWPDGHKEFYQFRSQDGNYRFIQPNEAEKLIEVESEVEVVDAPPNFTEKPWNNLQRVDGFVMPAEKLRVMQSRLRRGHNILLKGEPGTGKTILAELFAEQIGYKFHRLNVSGIMRPVDWFGEKNYSPDRGTYFEPSAFIKMIQEPCILQLDEINRTSPENPNSIFGFLDYNRKVFVDPLGRTIYRHPNCYIFATLNEGPHFTGTYPLDPAFKDRFTAMELELPSESDLANLLIQKVAPSFNGTTLSISDATTLAKTVRKLAEMYSAGKVSQYVGFRAAQNAGELRVDGEHLDFAVRESIIVLFSKEGEMGSERTKVLQQLQGDFPSFKPPNKP